MGPVFLILLSSLGIFVGLPVRIKAAISLEIVVTLVIRGLFEFLQPVLVLTSADPTTQSGLTSTRNKLLLPAIQLALPWCQADLPSLGHLHLDQSQVGLLNGTYMVECWKTMRPILGSHSSTLLSGTSCPVFIS